jgi:indole-3-glycerol phosphate synthase
MKPIAYGFLITNKLTRAKSLGKVVKYLSLRGIVEYQCKSEFKKALIRWTAEIIALVDRCLGDSIELNTAKHVSSQSPRNIV